MLNIQNISFQYIIEKKVFQDYSLMVQDGEILCLMGPSGCGKSTLLRILAGLEKIHSGSIESTYKKISYCFQEPRLFPWLTVYENLKLVTEEKERIEKILRLVGMWESKDVYPDTLSGGMKARVNLARALCFDGDLCLFDEPFASLDESLRVHICEDLREYLKYTKKTAIFVLHQKEDALLIADKIMEL